MSTKNRDWWIGMGTIVATAAILVTLMVGAAKADTSPDRAWDLGEVNKLIDQTNYVVNGGCSGTLISVAERHILTADHCVKALTTFIEEDEIQPDGTVKKVKRAFRQPLEVKQSIHDENGDIIGTHVYRAKIVRVLAKHDLALIQTIGPVASVMAAELPPADRKLLRGETAYIVGNPLGLEATVTKGVISHIKRELPGGSSGIENDVKYTQLDGGASPGNSGGAVFNERGQLVGVLVLGVQTMGHLSFAVDIDNIRAFLAIGIAAAAPSVAR